MTISKEDLIVRTIRRNIARNAKKYVAKATVSAMMLAGGVMMASPILSSTVSAATEHWNDASASKTESWSTWKANWDKYSTNYENVSLTPGATESQLNFAYYSKTEETPKVKIATKADMSDAKEVEGKQTQAVAIEGVQYYSNKASVNELKENTTYYYQVFQNGKYQDVQKYSTKSFKNYSFLYVGDPQIGASSGQTSTEGARIIVIVNKSGTNAGFTVYSQDRTMAIYGFAFACIIGIMFPIMYRGISPIVLMIIVAVLTTIVTLGLLGGYSSKTVSAILGTAIGVVIAAVAAMAFGKAAGITGYNVSDIEALNYVGQNTKIKIGELLFAGIIISALGAVMDVGMSIASTIQEIYETDKTLSMKRLFVSGINVGRDMMGTMTNTLIFAYVGGAMTTLVINYAYDLSYRQLANSYVIGIEIMQGLSGSLGVVLTVPITALIASFLAVRKK